MADGGKGKQEEIDDNTRMTAGADAHYPIKCETEYGDRLITLSTCDYEEENGRLIVVGVARG